MMNSDLKKVIEAGEFEGVPFTVVGEGSTIGPGDTYLAARNTGVKLLTCKEHNHDMGWVVPEERAYLYDTYECVRIELKI